VAVYIALLRGVNVGQNLLKMERLRDLCAELAFENVATYVSKRQYRVRGQRLLIGL
jgi:uncharacterized protein (DUF1697 family)